MINPVRRLRALSTWGATGDEVSAAMAGDRFIPDAPMSATRAIDLACPPEAAFDWLTQMGFGRAGWYSYDWLDNLGRPSAWAIHPEWQVKAEGEPIPAGPVDFVALVVDRPRSFVLGLLDQSVAGHRIGFTLDFRLGPKADGGTRLVSRARTRIEGPLATPLTAALEVGDGIMVRRQLLGLAERCRGGGRS